MKQLSIPAWLDTASDIPPPPYQKGQPACEATAPSELGIPFFCCRRPRHSGRHAASDGTRTIAVWGDRAPGWKIRARA